MSNGEQVQVKLLCCSGSRITDYRVTDSFLALYPQVRQNQRDTMWHTWTVTLGFPVMGIWQPGDDGTDINSACRWVIFCCQNWSRYTHTYTHAPKPRRTCRQLQPLSPHAHISIHNTHHRTYKNPNWQTLDPLAGSLEEYVLTSGDDGRVRLFNYPCVVENAPSR